MKNLKTRLSLLLVFVFAFAFAFGFQSMAAGDAVEDAKASVLTYEGMLARTTGDSGLRSMFRIDKAALATLEGAGYTVEIGATMGTSYFDGTKYNKVSDLAVTADAEKGYVTTAEKAVAVVVYSSTGADYATNKYAVLNANEYKFAFTTLFSETYETAEYYTAEFCYRGFLALTKDGVTDVIYVDADGALLGDSISLYEIVEYFVSGDYTGEKAEEFLENPKFLGIVETVKTEYPDIVPGVPPVPTVKNVYEYFPKDSVSADKLLADGETLLVNQTAHTFTVNVAKAGVYGVKLKYNSKNARVGYVMLKNNTVPNVKESEGRILENILTYEATPADYVVPDAHKTGAYQPDPENATMKSRYFGGDFIYIYLGEGDNKLAIRTKSGSSGTLEFGLYAMQFTLLGEATEDERIAQSEFSYGETTTKYTALKFGPKGDRTDTKYVKGEITVDRTGVYSLSGLVIVGPATTATVEFTDAKGNVVASPSFKWTNGTYAYATQTSSSYRYHSFGEMTLPAGTYSVKISMDENSIWYVGFSELYLTTVSIIPETLETPTVTVKDGVASWDAVKGATAYAYKVNGGETKTTDATSVTLENIGDTITVMAIGNEDEGYLDSAWSDEKTYHRTVFDIDFDTDITASVGLTKQTEGDFEGKYLLAAGTSNYFEFKVTPSVSGLYAISYDAATGSGSTVRPHHKNMTNKGDGWTTHATSAQLPASTTLTFDTTAAYQYLYAGEENTIRVYLENYRAPIYFSALRLSLYWEDIASAKQIITKDVVTDIIGSTEANCTNNTGVSGSGVSGKDSNLTLLKTGALTLRSEGKQTSSAVINLPKVSEAGDYAVYIVGVDYLVGGALASLEFSNGTTLTYSSGQKNAFNLDHHAGEAQIYKVEGEISLLPNTDYTVKASISARMWVGIHAIYLVKTGEYSGEKVVLDTPAVTVDNTGTASWEAVPGASGYEYSIDGAAAVKTTDTSVTLTEGQSIVVKALGEGAYLDSEYSESVIYEKGAVTEWEFDLADETLYTKAGKVSYADGFLYMPAGEGNYIEFTLNAATAGLYDISFIGKAPNRPRLLTKNRTNKGDGWSGHATSTQYTAGSTQSSYTRATTQYLYKDENTVRIYVLEGDYYLSKVHIKLKTADTEDTTQVVITADNSEVTKKVSDDGFTGPNGASKSGAMFVRVGGEFVTNLPRLTENGEYKLFALGAIYSSVETSFVLSDGTTLLFKPASLPAHYHEGNLYELGTVNLIANTDYTVTVKATGNWAGFHRFILVKVGEISQTLDVTSFSADPETNTLSASGLFASPIYNRAVLAAYDKDGEVIRKVALDKTETVMNFTDLTLTLTDSEAAEFSYARVYAVDGEDNEVDDITPYEYTSADTLTATAYTANASTGVFSAKIDFHSFSGKYATLALYNKAGAIVATASVEKTGYSLVGETLSVTLDAATAATVASMQVFVTDEKNGTTVNSDYTSFRYTMEGELRLLFVSDLHYNVMRGASGMNNNLNGMDADQRAQHFVDAILKENENAPITAVFLLGDLASAEDWYKKFDPKHASYAGKTNKDYDLDGNGTVNLDDYHGSKYDAIYLLNELYLSQIEAAGIPVYCVPGNHDTVDNAYWEKIFGYKASFGYTETEYIVKFPAQKTAVVMLNTFDKDKGSMTMSRNNDGKSYLAGTQQTLAYTPTDWELLKSFMDELVSEGYDTVYLAAHHFIGSGVYKKANEAYPQIKGYIYGDAHYDTVANIYGVPSFIDGHYSQSLIEYKGTYGERIFDLPRLPFSWMMLEQKGLVATVDYYKEEALYLGKDNYEFLSQYFNLTEGTKNNHMIILTRVTNVDTSVAGKITETITAGYYNYTIRTDISAEDQALAARIAYQIETYDMDMFLLSKGNLGYIPEGYEVTTMTYTTTEGGPFKVSGTATGWCYMYLSSMPRYESFFKEKMNYKSYEIFAGKVTTTYEDTDETTMTNKK